MKPLIGVTSNSNPGDNGTSYSAGDKYVHSVIEAANSIAVMLPAVGEMQSPTDVVYHLDGILFTGAPANIDPACYGASDEIPDDLRDPDRDKTNLPLIQAAIAAELPFLCICRGHQELNVALGGSLHQKVQTLPGKLDHRSDKSLPATQRYLHRHPIYLSEDGNLKRLTGCSGPFMVNSLHQQAIDRLADDLQIEARSGDDVIEAVSLKNQSFYNMSVQWHPEHRDALKDEINRRLFESFGEAAYIHMNQRLSGPQQ